MNVIRFSSRNMVIADEEMGRSVELASRAARSNAPVLICGESGTGKELIARLIHEKSRMGGGPYVSVNCAALPDGLMEAELFGYERGAFTGALNQRIGKFERAHRGTLLLDEVSELPLHLQAKLLRVLQEGEVDRLGSKDPVSVDTRIVSTTNRDPRDLVSEGSFRSDLFYRLNVLRIECAPLRGREDAILRLADHFRMEFLEKYGFEGADLDDSARRALLAHPWPGNIRELRNVMERTVLLAQGTISDRDLMLEPVGGTQLASEAHLTLEELERRHIQRTLEATSGNRNEAARRLGVTARTLRNKLNG